MSDSRIVETDVLIIGGGMAGCYAAIKAAEQGAQVNQVDKGFVGKSGQTPFAGSFLIFNPEWGDDLESWMNQFNQVGEFVNNRTWTEIGILESYAVYKELSSWGMEFEILPDGKPHFLPVALGPCRAARMQEFVFGDVVREQVLKRGVTIFDRTMITSLIKQDERIVGALGSPIETYDTLIFKAKAVVMCAGAGGFKPPGWPMHGLTADGDAMAYRVGAEIGGKEFTDTHHTTRQHPAHFNGPPAPPKSGGSELKGPPGFPLKNAEGDKIIGGGTLWLDMEFEVHAGRGPVYGERDGKKIERIGGASSGMSVHKAEGIWPAGTDCSSNIPGLYAAGDSLGNMQTGAVYAAIGTSISSCAITGGRAGRAAAQFAAQTDSVELDTSLLENLKQEFLAPSQRKGGFSPRWVTQVLQNAVMPYYILYIKQGNRLEATLTLVKFIRDQLVPKMFARDPHELRLAYETRNMVLSAEMRLRASLFRTESRGCHYREDYPQRNDPDWLAWVLLKEENGRMITIKKPIPQEWWPDLSIPIDERYPRFSYPEIG